MLRTESPTWRESSSIVRESASSPAAFAARPGDRGPGLERASLAFDMSTIISAGTVSSIDVTFAGVMLTCARLSLAATLAAAALLAPGGDGTASAKLPTGPVGSGPTCTGVLPGTPAPAPRPRPVLFGIYPGGEAGALLSSGAERVPDRPAADLRALGALRGRHAMVVHLYMSFTGRFTPADAATLRELGFFTARGYLADLALTYRSQNDVGGFVAFVRSVVDRLARNRRAIDLQVTNEVNFTASPSTSDGAYGGAKDALIQGVIAASEQARRDHAAHLRIGFNWFYRTDPASEQQFWSYLGQHGGRRFDEAVNWVGLDAYPGTYFPPASPPAGELTSLTDTAAMLNAFSSLRDCFMPEAGLGPHVAIHVSENGWPTGPGRSAAEQARHLAAFVQATVDYAGVYNITQYNWFDLRDSDSAGLDFEQHFGLLQDDYVPKPAFAVYRRLIARYGAGRAPRHLAKT